MLAASRCALAIMLSITTKVTRNHLWFELHLESTVSHNSCSDILALWGPRKRPSWLKTRSTGADVHGVQKRFPKVASSMQIVCYSSQDGWRCQGIPASVPASISWINATYEATTVGREMWTSTICASIILLIGLLTFGTVYLTMLPCLIQLTRLNPGLINFGNIKMLFMILNRNSWNRKSELLLDISISNCVLEYKMRA